MTIFPDSRGYESVKPGGWDFTQCQQVPWNTFRNDEIMLS